MYAGLPDIAAKFDCGEPTVKLITDALVRPLNYDFRDGKINVENSF